MLKKIVIVLFVFSGSLYAAQSEQEVAALADNVESDVIKWRRHFHQYPELSNREYNTAKYIASYLKELGLKVKTGVAVTGVTAVLDTGKPGPTVALRADMDALPITEVVKSPYASTVKTQFNDAEVGVMHACGHDTHMAMLMGAAKVLVQMKSKLTGKVKFIFQPAEEGAPGDEEGGAKLMVKEGVLKSPDVDVIFGLHIASNLDVGTVEYRHGGIMASADAFKIVIKGKQAHGAAPWNSADPIVTAAQLIMSLQTIVSRELKLIDDAAVVTVGMVRGGNRSNIIPTEVELVGTIRALDPKMREQIIAAVKRKAKNIAASMNTHAEVIVPLGHHYPIVYNPPDLMDKMLPALRASAGQEHVASRQAATYAEDFSFFQEKVPGLYLFVGAKPKKFAKGKAPGHHTPNFQIDESGMKLGVKLLSNLTINYMQNY